MSLRYSSINVRCRTMWPNRQSLCANVQATSIYYNHRAALKTSAEEKMRLRCLCFLLIYNTSQHCQGQTTLVSELHFLFCANAEEINKMKRTTVSTCYHRHGNDFLVGEAKIGEKQPNQDNQIQNITLCNMYFSKKVYAVYSGVWDKAPRSWGVFENFC